MISDGRFYARRATQERSRAARALTAQARDWHLKLAHDYGALAAAHEPSLSNKAD